LQVIVFEDDDAKSCGKRNKVPAAWESTLLVMESAVCDGEDDIALQSYRFACRLGPILDQDQDQDRQQQQQQQQQKKSLSVPWRDTIMRRLGAALMNLISGWLLERLCIILGR
jgi:hypothetical protein